MYYRRHHDGRAAEPAVHGAQPAPGGAGARARRRHRDRRIDRDLPVFRGAQTRAAAVRLLDARARARGDVAAAHRARADGDDRPFFPALASIDGESGSAADRQLGRGEPGAGAQIRADARAAARGQAVRLRESFTVADITGLVALDFMKFADIPLPEDRKSTRLN